MLDEKGAEGRAKRWVVVAPDASPCGALLLAEPANESQATRIGDQGGGRVFLFLRTDDFWRDHSRYRSHGVRFTEIPRMEIYGTVAVFEDISGNKWDLIQPGTGEPATQ